MPERQSRGLPLEKPRDSAHTQTGLEEEPRAPLSPLWRRGRGRDTEEQTIGSGGWALTEERAPWVAAPAAAAGIARVGLSARQGSPARHTLPACSTSTRSEPRIVLHGGGVTAGWKTAP